MRLAFPFRSISLCLLLVLLTCAQAWALDLRPREDDNKPSGWSSVVGAGAAYGPKFEGDDERRVVPIPYVDLRWHNRLFASTRDGIGINLYRSTNFTFATSANYMAGRSESASENLEGLGDISPSLGVGAFAIYGVQDWIFQLGATKGLVGDIDGIVAEFDADYVISLADFTQLILGSSLYWADSSYTQQFFGITPAQSKASRVDIHKLTNTDLTGLDYTFQDIGRFQNVITDVNSSTSATTIATRRKDQLPLAPYEAGGGFKNVDGHIRLRQALSDNWSMTTSAGYNLLLGDTASSPLIKQRGSVGNYNGALMMDYRF